MAKGDLVTKLLVVLGVISVAAGLAIGGWFIWDIHPHDPFEECRSNTIAGVGNIGGPFTLIDQRGRTVTDAQVIDRLALVQFGYTSCPDACRLVAGRNAQAAAMLGDMGIAAHAVFISVDPGRDTPAALADFAESVGPSIIALTGTVDQISAVVESYGAGPPQGAAEQEDQRSQTAQTYLMDPAFGLLEFFPDAFSARQVAEKAACFAGKLGV
jgi:protein SCO1/2